MRIRALPVLHFACVILLALGAVAALALGATSVWRTYPSGHDSIVVNPNGAGACRWRCAPTVPWNRESLPMWIVCFDGFKMYVHRISSMGKRQRPPHRVFCNLGLLVSEFGVVGQTLYLTTSSVVGAGNFLVSGASGSPSGPRVVVRSAVVPLWMLALLLGFYPAALLAGGALGTCRRRRRREKGLCAGCGYDLTGNVSGVCPECGEKV